MMQHTPEQAAVVAAPRGNLLVSAAAGSGKTAVLTDRIVQRIINDELDVRSVLVMTFTEAAARNMKEKIEKKLRAALTETTDPALRRRIGLQLSLLPGAAISTIHAFCLDVIRNFYNCARDDKGQPLVEPGFGVDDGVEADLLLRRTMDEWMADQYEAIDRADEDEQDTGYDDQRQSAFYRLMEGYGTAAGDGPVRELMLRLLYFMRSLPDYEQQASAWLNDLRAAAADFSDSPHQTALLRQLRLLLDRALDQTDEMDALLACGIRFISQPDRNASISRQMASAIETLRRLDAYLGNGGRDWDQIRIMTGGLAALDLPRAGKGDSAEKQAFMDLFCRYAAEVIYCLAGSCGTEKYSRHFIFRTRHLFSLSAAEIEADIAAMLPAIDMLFELVLGLDRQYALNKRSAGMIDFSDFEHLALRILREDEARNYYRGRFREVYVDEYQDTSSIQEEIIRAVSDKNCLMVGDIKQSIYRFRHARPRIFIDRAESFQSGQEGVLYELNRNFRSVAGILAATNDLFSQLMSHGAGEIDYDERQALAEYRADHPERPRPAALLLANLLPAAPADDSAEADELSDGANSADLSGPDAETLDAAELNRYEQEALIVAARMRSLHESGAEWKDMTVLSRTRSIGLACKTTLESFGIPVLAETGSAFLDTPVMRQMEALIRLLDNLRQDIPLAAVLRSEMFQGGFSAEELIRIRLFARENCDGMTFFHEAVVAYACEGPDPALRQKLAGCLEWLNSLRVREQTLSLGELIGLVYDETGWIDRLAAHPAGRGEDEIHQLRQFRQWAEQFEARRPRGLHAFAAYIDSLRKRGKIESPFSAAESQDDAVRVITIHGSKGLEFPVVFLVGTSYNLSPKDSSDCLLVSESLGLGMDYADPEQQIRYPTHLKLAMLEELKAASLAEELRLLYVAMTRAMDQLYIVGSVRISEDKAEQRLASLVRQARAVTGRQLPDHLVLAGKSYLDWLFMAFARDHSLDLDWLEGGMFPAGERTTPIWRIEYQQMDAVQRSMNGWTAQSLPQKPESVAGADPAALLQAVLDQPTASQEDHALLDGIRRRIVAEYRFADAARIPVKLTVSELKRREQGLRETGEIDPAEQPAIDEAVPDGWPRGITRTLHEWADEESGTDGDAGSLAASELGTLLHAFLRYMDLPAAQQNPDAAEIKRQLEAMYQAGIFTIGEIDSLSRFTGEFAMFASSDLAAAMVRAMSLPDRSLNTEMPFTLAIPASEVHASCAGLDPDDKVLVQGIIDCWFSDDDGITLVDYKSDRLTSDPLIVSTELEKRYGLQLEYYARAIRAALGIPVKRRLIWLIRQGCAVEIPAKETYEQYC